MTRIRESLPPVPRRLLSRPIDHRGYPVPWFVTSRDAEGRWDFRVASGDRFMQAMRQDRCWICGEPLGKFRTFMVGPMCTVSRAASDPPSHLECAFFAAQACPFLTEPAASRRKNGLPDDAGCPAGVMLERNPGLAVTWTTTRDKARADRVDQGFLWDIGDPVSVKWWCRGRDATDDEIEAAYRAGLPALVDLAERDGGKTRADLVTRFGEAVTLMHEFRPVAFRRVVKPWPLPWGDVSHG